MNEKIDAHCFREQPGVIPELKHCEQEIEEVLARRDYDAFRRIIEREGLVWDEGDLPEKYKSGNDCQTPQ
jgi:hypothetical protein